MMAMHVQNTGTLCFPILRFSPFLFGIICLPEVSSQLAKLLYSPCAFIFNPGFPNVGPFLWGQQVFCLSNNARK